MNIVSKKTNKKVVVVGAGIGGLSSAAYLARTGFNVTVLEKNSWTGGRLQSFTEKGFTFDMGPSWYWMPELYEQFFTDFGYRTKDFYDLVRLSPSYRVYFDDEAVDIPSSEGQMVELFEHYEPGAGKKLKLLLEQTHRVHEICSHQFIPNAYTSIKSLANSQTLKSSLQLLSTYNGFRSTSAYYKQFFNHPKLLHLLEFPIFFLGASPDAIPSVYALLNYVDIAGGTWYPIGGFKNVAQAVTDVAKSQGVKIVLDQEVQKIEPDKVVTLRNEYKADYIIVNSDYASFESNILSPQQQSYKQKYWQGREITYSTLLFFLGINKKLEGLSHHTLFFNHNWQLHHDALFRKHKWPKHPLYYVSCPSMTDPSCAPEGSDSLVILIPVPSNSDDSPAKRKRYFKWVLKDLEKNTGQKLMDHVVVNRSYAIADFERDYHAYGGNAFGLSQTALQTAIFRPRMRSRKLPNMYYCGHWTVPGIGVPMTMISGKLAAQEVVKNYES